MTRIAVVGGGIAGMAAAYELRRSAPDVDVVLHEASDRLGGKVRTSAFAGQPVDEGADAFLARVPAGIELCDELGLRDRLVSPATGVAYVWADGALRRLPDGLVLGVPTDLDAVTRTGLIRGPVSERRGPPLGPDDDMAVGTLVRDRFGDEVADRLVDPLLGGINAGDSDRLSIRAGTPQLAAAAERGDLLSAALREQRAAAAEGPVFYTLPGGMGALVDALDLALDGVERHLSSGVNDIDALDADAVVLAVPGFAAAPLLNRRAPDAAKLLAGISYASVALVTFAFAPGNVHRPLDGSGFLVPRTEGLLLTACSWATAKWAHLDDGRQLVVRASAGRLGDERALALDDAALVERLVADLTLTMDVAGDPTAVRVSRWPRSFPQYEPGHLDRVAAIEASVRSAPGPTVVLAGAALRGLGVPACIASGRSAAHDALTALDHRAR